MAEVKLQRKRPKHKDSGGNSAAGAGSRGQVNSGRSAAGPADG